jgi:hypothetical protein
MIQTQLHAEGLAVPVRILGVNPFDHARSNPAMCAGRDLPWLQETETDDVWSAWSVTYRDVIVLDADNVPVDVYNVTDYDLSVEANREELKQKLRAAATGNGR